MSTNLIAFENLTAFPTQFGDATFDLNVAAEEFASAKFPVISIANGRFHVKREGVTTLITRIKNKPSDPEEPASYIDMVVLNLQKAKTFYATGYTPGSEAKPDCFSNDGVNPDAGAEDPQCSTCALCEHNAWGSGTNEKGEATKGKACSDNLRLAVASPSDLDDAFMLRVPPNSLKNFAEVSKWLSSKRVPVNGAVIRISFDTAKVGTMLFSAIGGLDTETYAKANALKNSELVLSITGKAHGSVQRITEAVPKLTKAVAELKAAVAPAKPAVDPEVAAKKAKSEAKAAKLAAAQAALAAAQADEDEDEEEVAPAELTVAPAATKPAKAATKVVTSGSLDDELAALLA